MIRLIPREEIDKTKWNSCIHYATNGNIFGYMWYLDAMARHWDGLVEGDYESVMPLPYKNLAWGQKGLMQPPLIRELAVYSVNPPANDRITAFWDAIPADYDRIDVQVGAFSKPQNPAWEVDEQSNYFLPLTKAYELLREMYTQELIDQLEVARNADLFPSSNLKPEQIAALYRKTQRGLTEPQFHGLQRIMYNALHRGWGFASGVMNRDQEVLAADFFIFSHGRVMSLAPCETKAGKAVHAQAYLYDLMIRQQAGKPLALDFNHQQITPEFAKQFNALNYEYFRVQQDRRVGWRKWL